MGTDSEDTDPSSPSALRPNSQGGIAAAGVLPDPPSGQPTTDPGLGPGAAPAPSSNRRPMGVTVPAPSVRPRPGPSAITPPEITPIAAPLTPRPPNAKDSVELLLEGMAGPRPERRKTTGPQSDGEASAAYHAEHGVRRARTSDPAGPKVVVDRPVPGMVLREQRPSPALSKPAGRDAVSTFVPARVIRRRAAMALVAGVLIVLLSFMAMRLTGKSEGSAPSPIEATAAQTTASPLPTASPAEVPSRIENAQATSTSVEPVPPVASTQAPEPAQGDSRPAAPAHSSVAPTTRHHHGQGDPPGNPGDLGEFKSKF